jgi:pimeloyl-ACP methyl ester carboxylesterase
MTAGALSSHRDSPFRRVVAMAVPPISALPFRESVRHLPGQARRSWYMAYVQLPLVPERTLDRLVPKLWHDWSPAYDGAEDAHLALEALPDTAHRSAALDYYRHLARPVRVPERYRRWQASLTDLPSTPLLYLHGRGDTCLAPRFAEIARDHLPEHCSVRIVDGGGHFFHLEQPDEVARQVLAFLDG